MVLIAVLPLITCYGVSLHVFSAEDMHFRDVFAHLAACLEGLIQQRFFAEHKKARHKSCNPHRCLAVWGNYRWSMPMTRYWMRHKPWSD